MVDTRSTPVRGTLSSRIARAIKAPDRNYRYTGSFIGDNELLFSFKLNRQSAKSFYLYRGTLTLLSPVTRTPLHIVKLAESSNTQEEAVASVPLLVRPPKAGEDLKRMMVDEIEKKAIKLSDLYRFQYTDHVRQYMPLNQMSLTSALAIYLDAAALKQKKTVNARSTFRRQLTHVAENCKDVPIGEITVSHLTGALSDVTPEQKQKYLSALIQFLSFAAAEEKSPCPLIDAAIECKRTLKPEINRIRNSRQARTASNANALDAISEKKVNEIIRNHLFDPMHCCLLLVKGSGLDIGTVLRLRFMDMEFGASDTELFIRQRREYASATQNYTFPVFPYEAQQLWAYREHLKITYGEARVENDRLVFSADDGLSPLDAEEVKKLCKIMLASLSIGYAQESNQKEFARESGPQLLLNTYEYRLEKYCGISSDKENGAYLFMMHRSMAVNVLADHYRSFTGETGRQFLLTAVHKDLRDVVFKKHRKTTGIRTNANRKTTSFFFPPDACSPRVFTVDADEKDTIIISSQNGCKIKVVPALEQA